ncbi:MAG: NAD-dependent epimerase/dehydratase family protein [Holosporales bacterium]|jgi:UDP-glucuronate 4-epimerase|nr:NAD-dependent epimerase/dehydratase family protein [Holosporales bacterium]
MKILVTGAAGFIGNHVALSLLDAGHEVLSIDNCNAYYDPSLKAARLERLQSYAAFENIKLDLSETLKVLDVFSKFCPQRVIHLAAQAGVRYSFDHPEAYVSSNLVGFFSVLEACRQAHVEHLIYASTSSVYGANKEMPFSEKAPVNHPLSFYAATKRSNEVMAHAYSHLYKIPTTGVRFFTVYGPWGRPDMALFKFTKAILTGEPIILYNYGKMKRDFTYIDDIVTGVIKVSAQPAEISLEAKDIDKSPVAPYRIYNIGNSAPVDLTDYVRAIEEALGKKATCAMAPLQQGDVPETYADTTALQRDFSYHPNTPVAEGVARFVTWYKDFYNI